MIAQNSKTVLVTGATGFIGGYLTNELLKLGVVVIASSRSQEKDKDNKWIKK